MRVRWGRGPSIDGRLLESLPVARRYHQMAVVAGFLAATTTIAAAWLLSLLIAAVFVDSRPPDAVVPLLAALVTESVGKAGHGVLQGRVDVADGRGELIVRDVAHLPTIGIRAAV